MQNLFCKLHTPEDFYDFIKIPNEKDIELLANWS
jgi:hypothetical protein